MASLVAGSVGHATGLVVSMGTALQIGDVASVEVGGSVAFATSATDQLGNSYVHQQDSPGANGSKCSVFTSKITVAGTPTITLVAASQTDSVAHAFGIRGLLSATPNVKGSAGDTAANPMTASLSPLVTCTGIVVFSNDGSGGSFLSFTLGAATLRYDPPAGLSALASGLLLGQAPGTYALGANFTSGDTQDQIVVLWLPEIIPPPVHDWISGGSLKRPLALSQRT